MMHKKAHCLKLTASQYLDQVSAPNTLRPRGSGAKPPSMSSSFGNKALYLYKGVAKVKLSCCCGCC